MNEREIEKKLKQYAAACEQLVPREREVRIEALLQRKPILRTRGSVWHFVLEQIGYLGRYCLIWQALWIVAFLALMQNGMGKLLVVVSLFPPLLVLLTVEEITKVYQRSMLEIEYATKYSLQGVIMTRMSVLCVFHSVILCVCILLWHARLESGAGQLLVYGFTPMIVMTGILLNFMQRFQGELLRGAVCGVYAVTVALTLLGNSKAFGWYLPDYFKAWCVVCIAGIVFGIWQFVCLHHKLSGFEQIV